jgi:hypothetical protein
MIYTKYKLKCPHCGGIFQTVLDNDAIQLGPRIRTCNGCKGTFSDGSAEWPELTPKQRRKFLFRGMPWFLGFFGLWAAFPIYMGIEDPKSSGVPTEMVVAVLMVAAGLLVIFYLICGVQIALSRRRYARVSGR